jgi:hypothetical protein
MIGGVRIIQSEYCADVTFDTSRCRSPARALRRLNKRGIIGRIVQIVIPWKHCHQLPNGDLVMHPETYKRLQAEMDDAGGIVKQHISSQV